jgi:SM-20-related protein
VARSTEASEEIRGEPVRAAAASAAETLRFLDLEAFRRTPLVPDPFPFLVVPGFVLQSVRAVLTQDYPDIPEPGSFPIGDLHFGPAFAGFVAELESPVLRSAFAEKFDIDLANRPTMITARGQARAADGRIHTDTSTKLITVLIYMNESWEAPGGRLRLLRSRDNLDDVIAEVPPAAGTLLAFRVTPHSWHGHTAVSGPRRVIQLNWVENEAVVRRERLRHGLSARVKRLLAFVR